MANDRAFAIAGVLFGFWEMANIMFGRYELKTQQDAYRSAIAVFLFFLGIKTLKAPAAAAAGTTETKAGPSTASKKVK